MEFKQVESQLLSSSSKVAKRSSWKVDRLIDNQSLSSINESDKLASDWVVLDKINE